MFVHDKIRDNGLQVLVDDGDLVVLCTGEPANYADALALADAGGDRVGSAAPTIVLADAAGGGRAASLSTITGASIEADDATGTDQGYAVLDTVLGILLVSGTVTGDQVVVSGNTWSTTGPVELVAVPDAA